MTSLSTAWKILRDLGPSWVLKRISLATQMRLGLVKKRLPLGDWQFESSDCARSPAQNPPTLGKVFFSSNKLPVVSPQTGVCEQADRVLSGEWPFFSHQWRQLGFPPDWHINALDGTRIDDRVHWSEIDINAIHDVKFVWEPNRFSVAYLLARAYAAFGDERYPEAFWQLVEDWAEKNPPNRGVNWASGQEVALRAMAWCFGLHAFLRAPSSNTVRVSKLLQMIEVHGNRIARFIDYALSQRNNHGTGEAVGLFTIGVLFPEFRSAEKWRRLGRALIESQARDQVYDDGSYIQHSFNYQRVFIDYLVWAFRLGELNNEPFSAESKEILARAAEFMLRFCDPATGSMPNYGSNDGSLVLPLSSCDFLDFRPSLQAAHYLVNQNCYFGKGVWDEQSHWLFGTELIQDRKKGRAESQAKVQNNHPASGYLKLVAAESHAMLRAARYVDRPSQADQLHFDLWWRGENIACDAGTYLYNAPSTWANGLAGTTVHNTIIVGHRDQMSRAGRFLWLDWAQADWKSYETLDRCQAIEAWHDGYESVGAKSRRSVVRIDGEDWWIVVDDIDGDFHGDVRLHWLFGEYPHSWDSNELRLKLQTPVGEFQCCVHGPQSNAATLVIGGNLVSTGATNVSEADYSIRGWRSLYYGEREPALSLAMETHAPLPVRFVTVLAPAATSVMKVDDTLVEVCSQRDSHRISLGAVGSEKIFRRSAETPRRA